jgi:hopene-associated glycosyltransferase HpnB
MMFVALLTLGIWLALIFAWHGYWRSDPDLPNATPTTLPSVAILIPARNEAASIGQVVAQLRGQDYAGSFTVTVINDDSSDDTAAIAAQAGANLINASPLPTGWSGKLSALQQGVLARPIADLYWFTDADILHAPDALRRMVAQMEQQKAALVSVMAHLRCISFWEKLLVPAFIYFFAMLYPFRAINHHGRAHAGAAGGSILIKRTALEHIGGIAAYKDALIDDCTLAKRIKYNGGGLWLGYYRGTSSLRAATSLAPLWQMVRRTAFNQLGHNYALLAGTVAGLVLTFLAPIWLSFVGYWPAMLAWALMSLSYMPTLHRYRLGLWRALLLPVSATLYLLMTLDSARVHAQGRGGGWKGRTYA